MVFIHAYESLQQIPSELEANSKILDEAFPAVTIDLVFLKGSFGPTVRISHLTSGNSLNNASPQLADAVCAKLDVPLSSCFMFTPSEDKEHDLASYGGIRVMA